VGLLGGRAGGGHKGQLGLHGPRGGGHGSGAHGAQQVVAVGEMAVGRIGRHTRAACGLAQHHRIRPALARQFDARVQQRTVQIPVAV